MLARNGYLQSRSLFAINSPVADPDNLTTPPFSLIATCSGSRYASLLLLLGRGFYNEGRGSGEACCCSTTVAQAKSSGFRSFIYYVVDPSYRSGIKRQLVWDYFFLSRHRLRALDLKRYQNSLSTTHTHTAPSLPSSFIAHHVEL